MILLTFNIVKMDFSHKDGKEISLDDRLFIIHSNVKSILRILDLHDTKATFFIEVSIAENSKDIIKAISAQGHEIAFYNKNFEPEKMGEIKREIEAVLEKQIRGIRQRDFKIPVDSLKQLEFNYISNIDNANVLFPFKRLKRNTEIIEVDGLSCVPESISPYSQLPYNDFVFQVVPMRYYQSMVFETLKRDDYVLIYLDAWQFTDINKYQFEIPIYRKYNAGRKMEDKLSEFLSWINEKELATSRMKDFLF